MNINVLQKKKYNLPQIHLNTETSEHRITRNIWNEYTKKYGYFFYSAGT